MKPSLSLELTDDLCRKDVDAVVSEVHNLRQDGVKEGPKLR
jgi:hypothetical protein